LFFLFALLRLEAAWTEIVLNSKGWNLPDTAKMVLIESKKVDINGIPREIRMEIWMGKDETKYRIRNLLYADMPDLAANHPVLENPLALWVYKAADGTDICYRYTREITDKAGFTYGVVITFICDLDADGVNEFQIEAGIEPDKMLASILRIKLGLSDEADLIKRTIRSALRAMKKKRGSW